MRILFLNYEYPPLGGGAGNAAFYLLREFAKINDLEIDLVTSSADNEYYLEKVGERIRVHKLPIGKNQKNLHFQSQKDLLVYAWKACFFARKLFKKNKYNLTHSFFTVPCGLLSLIFKITQKIPYVVSLRGADVPGYSERFSVVYKFIKPIIKKIWKYSSGVVANSQGLKNLALKSKPDQEISVIYNGVDTDHFSPSADDLHSQSEFIITTGASRLTARKGLNYLLEALRQLKTKYPFLKLKIMGEGSDKSNLERLAEELRISDRVEFIGRIPREETAPYYREANLFVLPSLNEGMSNAMLEALASGLPVVTTDTGGTRELVQEGINGFTVKMRDAEDLAAKIEKIIKDKSLRLKMAQKSREISRKFSWKSVAEQYYEIYKKTLNSK